MTRRIGLSVLVGLLAWSSLPMAAGQEIVGAIAGRATDEAQTPYSDYAVQLRDVGTGLVVGLAPLNTRGEFAFGDLPLSRKYLVELVNTRKTELVCTEGPYALPTTAQQTVINDVNVECGRPPAAFYLLATGAGTAAAIALAQRSPSQ